MDRGEMMQSSPVQILPLFSSCPSTSSRSPPVSPTSRSFDASSYCSSSGLIETLEPTISQISDCSNPSASSQPMVFRATDSSLSKKLDPKFECLSVRPNNSLKYLSPSCKPFLQASVVVDIPRPLESLQSSPIPPFLSKTYEIVNDPSLDRLVSWSPAGQSFVVWDPVEFSRVVLPRHFKHNNFSSFVRQLNTYGFRKIDGDRWEFANEEFLRGKRLLLKNISRRKSPRGQPKDACLGSSIKMELVGAEDGLQKLKNEKHMLKQEVVKLNQEHLAIAKQMDKLNCGLQSAELRQKQMISFMGKVLRNPVFLMQLKQKRNRREIAPTRSIERSDEHAQPSESYVSKVTTEQTVKSRQNFCELGSTFVLQGLKSSPETQLTDHLLQDMSDKLDLDVNVQEGSSNKPHEIEEASFNPDSFFKEEIITTSKEDASVDSADFYISSPEEFSSNTMFMEPISPLSQTFTRQDLQIDTSSGERVGEIQDGMACHNQYLESPIKDVSQEPVSCYSVNSGGETACKEEEFWNVDFEAGGSFTSAYDMWGNLACTNYVGPGDGIGLSEMCDFGLHSDEDFYFNKCFGSQFPHLPDMDEEDGLRLDHLKTSEP